MTWPVPPPPECDRHIYPADGCQACEDFGNWCNDFNAWLASDEGGRWLDLNEFEEARWAQLEARSAA